MITSRVTRAASQMRCCIGNAKPSGITPTKGVLAASQLHGMSDHARIAAEARLPYAVPDHNDWGGTVLLVSRQQRASNERWHTNQPERRRADLRDLNRLGSAILRYQVTFERRVGAEVLNRSDLVTPRDELGQRVRFGCGRGSVPVLNGDDLLTRVERERRIDEVVSEFEEHGADRNGDGHGQTADQRKAGILDQHPTTQLEVQPTGSHRAEAEERTVPSVFTGAFFATSTHGGVRRWHPESEDEHIVIQNCEQNVKGRRTMNWTESDIHRNRDYFQWKLHATKQRADVVKAIDKGPFDFLLLDTRSRDAFGFGHITGAWCAPLEELESVVSRLPKDPKDKEIVTYCWGHD